MGVIRRSIMVARRLDVVEPALANDRNMTERSTRSRDIAKEFYRLCMLMIEMFPNFRGNLEGVECKIGPCV